MCLGKSIIIIAESRLSFRGGRATQPLEGWNQWLTSVEDLYYRANRKDPILLKIVGEVWNVLIGHNSDPIRNDLKPATTLTRRQLKKSKCHSSSFLGRRSSPDAAAFPLHAIVLRLRRGGHGRGRGECEADEELSVAGSPAGRGRTSSVSGVPADGYDWEQDGAIAGEASRETGGGSGGCRDATRSVGRASHGVCCRAAPERRGCRIGGGRGEDGEGTMAELERTAKSPPPMRECAPPARTVSWMRSGAAVGQGSSERERSKEYEDAPFRPRQRDVEDAVGDESRDKPARLGDEGDRMARSRRRVARGVRLMDARRVDLHARTVRREPYRGSPGADDAYDAGAHRIYDGEHWRGSVGG
ncbi:hypothetical protein B0H14DRAFT_2593233 [Mycena olivaceomarginata]|nr:hypothetical protein B0H14DRAFT_2593233 [Mycena olivaceomarginata]